ncbi:MAG: serine/threonine protein kinase [Acidobacteria bacterium]|nr:serine/threonine protein kinase [Acidobacteriota bacterium]
MQPEKIGRYVILRTLGRGAMGVVYLARDPQIERELALKTIRFDDGEKSFSADEAKARFLKEAKISGRLQHPHIVTVFDVGEDQGVLYLAMELVQGGSFSQRLADPAGFSIRDRVRVVAEVAEALAHAHERGVLHRDIKPANILLSPSLSAKVTDFGIGKLLTGDTELTSTGQMVGSPAYMSPEQIKGDKLDARTDIFSLGVVLYQAVTLRKPFPADTLTTLVYQILHEEPADPAAVAGDLPEGLGAIVSRCLAKDRANRYADAAELADDLRAVLGFSPVGSTASFSESRVKRGKSTPSSPATPQLPPQSPHASMAPTAAMPVMSPGPVGAAPAASDSESPTITTGRRMGEVAKKAEAKVGPPAAKKGLSAATLGALGIVAALAVLVAVALKKGGATDAQPVTSASPAATSAPAPAPPASVAAPSTGGPAVAVVETPAASAAPAAPTPPPAPKKTRVKPTPSEAAASASASAAKAAAKPTVAAVKPVDLTYTIRRFLKINVSPSQARVFMDGNYIGISDDWDDAGGGSLLTFNLEGQHRLRICYPEHRDLLVDVIVRSTAADDKVTIEQDLPKGVPDGPTGPEGSFRRPNYKSIGAVLFNVDPPDAMVTVNGKEYGPASKWLKEEMTFANMAVYQVALSAPGYETKTVRVLIAPTAGELRATVKERLKKQ